MKKLKGGMYFAALAKVDSLICNKYAAIMRHNPVVMAVSTTNSFSATISVGGVLRVPITQSLTFLSSLQVSIPKKRLWGMGS